jgi:hypothetical protein
MTSSTLLSLGSNTIATVTAGQKWALTTVNLCNFSITGETVDLHIVDNGDTADTSNIIHKAITFAGGVRNTQEITTKFVLENEASVVAVATNGGRVTATLSWVVL